VSCDAVASKLKRSETGTRGAQRIVRRRIKSALQRLGRKTPTDRSVHAARKELKKARATLRLLRDALGKTAYKRENAALRDAARPLSEVRDGRVLLDTLSSLGKYYGARAKVLPLTRFERVLQRSRSKARASILRRSGPLKGARKTLRAAHARAIRWPMGRRGWSVLGAGVNRTYSRGRRALQQVRAQPSDERLHEWRKQTKYFWYQLQDFEPLGLGPIAELEAAARKLSDFLGDDHDLAVLYDRAAAARDLFPSAATHRALLALISRCRAGLQEKALVLGQRIYGERPAVFTARLAKHWHERRRT
jgi:CHAD domain-containing protein